MTAILPCKCSHACQDAVYGSGNRVHNHALKANQGSGGWRCTVCQNVKAEKADKAGKKKADSADSPAAPKGKGKKGTPPAKTKKKETGNIRGKGGRK